MEERKNVKVSKETRTLLKEITAKTDEYFDKIINRLAKAELERIKNLHPQG